MKYRKKPVEVEAYQITRDLIEGYLFDNIPLPQGLQTTSAVYNKKSRYISDWFGQVITIHNQKTKVVEGDWIITEPNGLNHYPCKPDIFEQTFEPIEL